MLQIQALENIRLYIYFLPPVHVTHTTHGCVVNNLCSEVNKSWHWCFEHSELCMLGDQWDSMGSKGPESFMRTWTVLRDSGKKFSKVNKAKPGLVKKSFQGWQDFSVSKISSTQPDHLNSIPGIHVGKRDPAPQSCTLHHGMYTPTHIHNTIMKFKRKLFRTQH